MKRIIAYTLILGSIFSGLLFGTEESVIFRRRHGSISRQNLLENSRFYWHNGCLLFKSSGEEFVPPDTCRILAIRVEFHTDDDDRTTGNGHFDLDLSSESIIDPPPHDRVYFENQMTALAHYYRSVSNGKLILVGEVLSEVFTLSREMGHYNPGTTEALVDQGLAELFYDAIEMADSAGVHFSEYDCYIIFHAGVGRDIDLGFDPTPSDIPSAFLNLEDFRKYVGEGNDQYQGIEVEDGQFYVREGIILPETESQEGYEIGLLGTMTLMFGFQIGLPALWNTQTGRSGIGAWGLMDQGSGNYYGLIPAEPCAWSKVFMGWEIPIETLQGEHLPVACSKAINANKIYKVPINEHEYFLIENRSHDPNGDGVTTGWDETGNRVTFQANGQLMASQPFGVIVGVEEYDYGLPGSGILIWHIDEEVIGERYKANRVNGDRNHRGVDLEEADGAQDIGEAYGFISGGAGSESGVLHDAWFMDNEIHLLANGSTEVLFGADTYPNSRSNTGANSHIIISNFSSLDTVMSFAVQNDFLQEGFPQDLSQEGIPYTPLFGDLDGGGDIEIVVVTDRGKIYAWKADGTAIISGQTFGYRVTEYGDTVFYPVALFIDVKEDVTAHPVMGDINQDDQDDVFIATERGEVAGYTYHNDSVEKIWEWRDENETVTFLGYIREQGIIGHQLVIGTESGKILAVGPEGDIYYEKDLLSGGVVGICQYGYYHIIATTEDGHAVLIDEYGQVTWNLIQEVEDLAGPVSSWSGSITSPRFLAIVGQGTGLFLDNSGVEEARFGEGILPLDLSDGSMGDVDGDGFIEVCVTGGGRFFCFNHNGSLLNDFPFPHLERDIELSSPILGDIDGDGKVDVLAVSSLGHIEGYRSDGTVIDGFPLTTGGSTSIPPVILDLDDDGDVEVAAVSDDGLLFIWDLPGIYDPELIPWGSLFHDPAHSGLCPQKLEKQPAFEEILPSHLVYNYPNPTEGDFTTIRYRLEHEANVLIRIFDLAGELIDEVTGPGNPQTENEVVWNLRNVESGVYFCQVKAMGIARENVVTFKIAVVK